MRRLIGFLAVVGVAVGAAVWLADRPGMVTVQWVGWRLDTSVPILLLVIAVLAVGGSVLVRLVARLIHVPKMWAQFRSRRALDKGLNALAEALAALFVEDMHTARKKADTARAALANAAPATLILARAAQATGETAKAKELFDILHTNKTFAGAAVRGLLDIAVHEGAVHEGAVHEGAVHEGDRQKIRTLAAQAVALYPGAGWAVRTLLESLCKDQDWPAAQKLLERGGKSGVFTDDERSRLTAILYCVQADSLADKGETLEGGRLARKAVDAVPGFLPAILRLASAEAAGGNIKKAAAQIEEQWRRTPHAALGEAYLALWPNDPPLARVSHAETLANCNPEHLESRLLVAGAALAADLWGQVRNRLQDVLETTDPRVALLMADVEAAEKGDQAAVIRWLRRAAVVESSQTMRSAAWTCDLPGDWAEDSRPRTFFEPDCGTKITAITGMKS